MDYSELKKEVRVKSFSFNNKPVDEIIALVEQEAKKDGVCDVIVLPETWSGDHAPELLDEKTTAAFCMIAKQYNTYIINAIARKDNQGRRFNSSILINRQGEVQGLYNKVYPYWSEFELEPIVTIGTQVPVFETDFGKIGMAICFDANFPCVWQELSDKGADIVFWSSAYSAGTSLQAHAINHNYYIVTSTLCGDCIVYDITGKEIFYQQSDGDRVQIVDIVLDINREIFHENYNMDKKDTLLSENVKIILEQHMEREQWFVLKGTDDSCSVKEIRKQYGMETLSEYKYRSRVEIDKMRKSII